MGDNGHASRGQSTWALLQRQSASAVRALLRPRTYVGAALEGVHTLVHLAAYPTGLASADALQATLHAERAMDRIPEHLDEATASMPVVLVHGYVHNRSAFLVMGQALKKAGFRHVHTFNYPQFTHGIPEIAALLAGEVERLLAATGASRCIIVGHSMGGIVARTYVQQLGGEDTVDTIVTLGTPHLGTMTATLGVGPAAWQMNYRSPFLLELERSARPSRLRYICYYSDLDAAVVPAVSAKLAAPALQAVNLRVRDIGHLSLLLSAPVLGSVVQYLSDPALGRPVPPEEVAPLPTAAQRYQRPPAPPSEPDAPVPETPAVATPETPAVAAPED